jgi:transposase
LREVVRLYGKTVQDGTRLKNRIRAKYRQQGLTVGGREVFAAEGREAYLRRVKRPTIRLLLEVLYQELDAVEAAAECLARRLSGMLGHRREYRRLLPIPGIGPVTAAILVAVIDDPHRFATTRKFWNYAGLSVRHPWSGRPDQAKTGGSSSGHRLLKYAAMMAARHALRGDNRFSRHHAQMVKRGLDPAMADRTIARGILATVLAVWKDGTDYRESRLA